MPGVTFADNIEVVPLVFASRAPRGRPLRDWRTEACRASGSLLSELLVAIWLEEKVRQGWTKLWGKPLSQALHLKRRVLLWDSLLRDKCMCSWCLELAPHLETVTHKRLDPFFYHSFTSTAAFFSSRGSSTDLQLDMIHDTCASHGVWCEG
jgi:hypothetical protein